jgi:hypothetical protein
MCVCVCVLELGYTHQIVTNTSTDIHKIINTYKVSISTCTAMHKSKTTMVKFNKAVHNGTQR